MIGRCLREKRISSGRIYIRSTSDTPPNWMDIRNSYIPPDRHDIRSIADIPKLGETAGFIMR
jgi:hypothetical protein